MLSVVSAITPADIHKMLYVITLFDSSLKKNLVFRLAFLHKSYASMQTAVINTKADLVFTDFVFWYNPIQLYCHWVF